MSVVEHAPHSVIPSKMISLQAVLLFSMGIAFAVAWDPDCSSCEYHNNIGFVKGEFCQVYYMCVKNPYRKDPHAVNGTSQSDLYRWYVFCCAEGLAWDEQHLTCKRDGKCKDSRHKCPNITSTTDLPCPNKPDPDDKTKYFTSTHEQMICPHGTVWNQDYCTCIRGAGSFKKPCDKILDFSFNATYDSYSCYNFAKGEPYGNPSLDGGILCLNGEDQFLTVGFLNNWFGWNPQARTFTLCLSILPAVGNQNAGLVSLNCDMVDPQTGEAGSVVDIVLKGGVVHLILGRTEVNSFMVPRLDEWTRLCVTFNNGEYNAYWNADNHFSGPRGDWPYKFAPNTHSATTLGYKNNFGVFQGYIDDFLFFTEAKDDQYFKDTYVPRSP